jgi:hypothetical protein
MNEAVAAHAARLPRHLVKAVGSLQTRLVGVVRKEQNGNASAAGCAEIHRLPKAVAAVPEKVDITKYLQVY